MGNATSGHGRGCCPPDDDPRQKTRKTSRSGNRRAPATIPGSATIYASPSRSSSLVDAQHHLPHTALSSHLRISHAQLRGIPEHPEDGTHSHPRVNYEADQGGDGENFLEVTKTHNTARPSEPQTGPHSPDFARLPQTAEFGSPEYPEPEQKDQNVRSSNAAAPPTETPGSISPGFLKDVQGGHPTVRTHKSTFSEPLNSNNTLMTPNVFVSNAPPFVWSSQQDNPGLMGETLMAEYLTHQQADSPLKTGGTAENSDRNISAGFRSSDSRLISDNLCRTTNKDANENDRAADTRKEGTKEINVSLNGKGSQQRSRGGGSNKAEAAPPTMADLQAPIYNY